MNIQSIRPEILVEATNSKSTNKSAESDTTTDEEVRDSYMPEQNESLLTALQNQPDVRPEVLNRAKQLAADPSYPSKDIINAIANAFVSNTGR
jgi:hypothetical protein